MGFHNQTVNQIIIPKIKKKKRKKNNITQTIMSLTNHLPLASINPQIDRTATITEKPGTRARVPPPERSLRPRRDGQRPRIHRLPTAGGTRRASHPHPTTQPGLRGALFGLLKTLKSSRKHRK